MFICSTIFPFIVIAMSTPDQNRVISQNGKDLTQQSIPKIIQAKYRTQNRPSTSQFFFSAQHLPWLGFEKEVRRNFQVQSQTWDRHSATIAVRRESPHKFDIVNEMFQCGDELSLSGRFVQQVLHVMTAVSRDLNLPIRFGDFKTVYTRDREEKRQKEEKRQGAGQLSQSLSQTGQSDDTPVPSQPGSSPGNTIKPSKDPDYAATNEDHRVRVVGEIKTPWTQDLEAVRPDDIKWRRWMGGCLLTLELFQSAKF